MLDGHQPEDSNQRAQTEQAQAQLMAMSIFEDLVNPYWKT